MFGFPSKEIVESIKRAYPEGTRVELVRMNDEFSRLNPGDKGTVRCVDDTGTIHISWDNGSGLGIVYGEDSCKKLDSVKVTCYGTTKIWDNRQEALEHFLEGMACCGGSERERYTNIYLQLMDGCTECVDIW